MAQDDVGAVDDWMPITDVFAAQSRRRPDALAVEARGERRSYGELARRVDLFAARLAARLDTGGERLVGVCLERDVDLPAWLLAILKVGAAYLPIDPTTPPARLAHLLEDGRPALIVASRCHAPVVAGVDVPVMIAEDAADPAAAVPGAMIPSPVGPRSLAYVIFTSGSTGRPKCVEVEHRSLSALMATMAASPGLGEGQRMLGVTRISFDLSVPDLFLPFFVGGSLALVDLDVAADPDRLAAAFADHRPDLAQATPSMWRALLENGWEGQPGLRVLAGGEPVTRALADRLLPCCAEVWNMYGPTEATVWATAFRVMPGTGPVPIGGPMAGASVEVVDQDIQPMPVGGIGEIVIGGIGVARGYRNRPDLTAARFVTTNEGERVYRTGDLGRVDEAGTLFCLGRLDDQVKIRGFRIELGDVEAALAFHPAVAWGAVRSWPDPSGEPVLVAYVVPRGAALDVREMKSFLATRIPTYMVPDRIVAVAVMPLTSNGKVDRASLPNPFAHASPIAPAGGGIQDQLAAIWRELLGVAAVGPDDDFFDLGGYSLMTVRLTRRIEAEFGTKLALIELMRHSTLAAMAARIGRGEATIGREAMLLNDGGTRAPLFWLDAGPLTRTVMRGLSSDQPAYALNIDATDEEALGGGDLSIPRIAACLATRLVAQQPAGPYYIGGWCRWGIVAFELARQLTQAGETVGLLVLLDAERPGRRAPRQGLRRRIGRWLRASDMADIVEPPSFSQRVEIATRTYPAGRYAGDVLLVRPETGYGDAGWAPLVGGTLEIARIPGDHESMVRGAPAQVLAAKLDRALLAAQDRTSPGGALGPSVAAAEPVAAVGGPDPHPEWPGRPRQERQRTVLGG
ncbi:amino acid adenylation domain-containing protein [uncultured Sphingomonas sp.]|uniref:amino acid adenylation domain-containing protein n=1 Tax=uncultured Sphingomonas sp. TaxID=158754 RepID=UPI0035CB06E0